ncbi:uncharacterized protein LOC110412075 isoform X1 [Herrania umbratica]|uniref:Uncharacterized protein LOC110412075 isoform X1 n=1 Tax=Herrania umbratica TaxID=108875 RepID=A0A6J0ZU18_9ROSI|nr:uncharacterized protein LOC110412075 isoform X1 [Herrania umbratica]XP_021278194.1 uncharacterized protein LOC110412075 isoform X1 [Herrania umbratica]XP_021278202.1 uncharacterized protein LOC110412075 isoform X1 [Herrania umbratica]XP_021278210.1 uncharacterized protein LOC110412075 isoform X1 [Herrania umbratica]XP_021278218.1 uncharacterized protein LOC110412075 isoform X1 [Herrania umbratica]
MNLGCVQLLPTSSVPLLFAGSSSFLHNHRANPGKLSRDFRSSKNGEVAKGKGGIVCGWLLPVDPWAPNIDSQSIASQLFAVSLFPYIGFLYFITKSKSAPKLTLFGFYFLLAFVGATIPAGIYGKFSPLNKNCFHLLAINFYTWMPNCDSIHVVETAKVKYGTSLSNVDWLHGGAESLLTLTNLFIVLGLRQALRKTEDAKESTSSSAPDAKEQKKPFI